VYLVGNRLQHLLKERREERAPRRTSAADQSRVYYTRELNIGDKKRRFNFSKGHRAWSCRTECLLSLRQYYLNATRSKMFFLQSPIFRESYLHVICGKRSAI